MTRSYIHTYESGVDDLVPRATKAQAPETGARFKDYLVPVDGIGGPPPLEGGMSIVGAYRMAQLLGL